eukprot:CCRYP_018002-RA/>CCRYP_018002-RA protein AED:0.00 eAED:0.00 QI:66/1/1/1/0/0/2/40/39
MRFCIVLQTMNTEKYLLSMKSMLYSEGISQVIITISKRH